MSPPFSIDSSTRMALWAVLCVVAAGLLLSACGEGPPEGSDSLSGSVRVDGSSTVFPINEAVAEEFMIRNPYVRVTVGVSGTGGGFSKFLRGETDINAASRPIDPHERDLAEQNGVEYIELPISFDGLAIVVHPSNEHLNCISTEELAAIWQPDSQVDRWSQVRDGFPDQPLRLYGPGTDSGTYDYFTAAIMGEQGASRSDFTASEDDNVLVQGIQGDRYAMGFFGLAYYENNANSLKLVAVDDRQDDNGEGCISPSFETIQAGAYQPLARPEFIYVNVDRADIEQVEAFVEFYLAHANELVREVGYVPLSEEGYRLALSRFRDRTTGTLFESKEATVGLNMEDKLRQAEPRDSLASDDSVSTPPTPTQP